VTSTWIDVQGTDGKYQAYLSLPPAGTGPGLVLFQEIFGVNGHIRAVADQYALDGYVVLAPDVFWRLAPRVELGYHGADLERARALRSASDPGALGEDIKSSVAALRSRPEFTGNIGALGYCMGGRLAYQAAAQGGLEAAVSFYGGSIHNQLDIAAKIRCPMMFHHGALDRLIPAPAVASIAAAFAGKDAQFYLYESADHGFNCWARQSYHQPSAALAHGRTLEHFATHLV